jgi:glycosyltransferase involved in cell wall biosynthesis
MNIFALPLVSIVLPTFNGFRFLSKAIESILSQTYSNWELIIVDDTSTDQTPELIEKYVKSDSRIRSTRHEVNKKLPASLNTGFSQAKGEYLTWTSDDNCYKPDALEIMVNYLVSNPSVSIVYADYLVIDEIGNIIKFIKVEPFTQLVFGNCIGPCFLYRRSVQDTVGYYAEDMFLAEDYDFWLRASKYFSIKPIHKDLYLYRKHSSSLTKTQGQSPGLIACDSLKQNLPNLKWLDNTMLSRSYLHIATLEQFRKNIKEMRVYVIRAIRQSPVLLFSSITLGLLIHGWIGEKAFLISQQLFHLLIIPQNEVQQCFLEEK